MNWALLSITREGMLNAGNLLVEQCVLECLPPPVRAFSVFTKPTTADLESIRAASCRFFLCTGTTLLTRRNSKFWQWADRLESLSIPVAMVGGCFWNSTSDGTDVIVPGQTLLSMRDSYSLNICRQFGYDFPMVGCPSLLMSEGHGMPALGRHIVVGFHRHSLREQVIFFRTLSQQRQRPLRVLVQEDNERLAAAELAAETGGEIINLAELRSRSAWEQAFEGTGECISGRLHQVLPAAAMGIPSVMVLPDRLAGEDSRLSLLRHLAIPIQVIGSVDDEELLPKSADAAKLRQLTVALKHWLTQLETDPERLRTPRVVPSSTRQYLELEQRLRESITSGEAVVERCEDQAASVRTQQGLIREMQAKLQKYRGDAERKKQLIEQLQETVQQLQGHARNAIEKSATGEHR